MEEMNKIRARKEIPESDKWAIEDLYANEELWEADLQAVAAKEKELTAFAGHLGDSGETLYNFLYMEEMNNITASRVANYCMRRADEDTRDAHFQELVGKFISVVVNMNAATSFSTPEIMGISDETLDVPYRSHPGSRRRCP